MIDLNLRIEGLDDLRAQVQAETRNLVAATARAVEDAGKSGKAAARVAAPHRSYELRDSIDARLVATSAMGADGEMFALADHASMVRDGTRAHIIEARRKKALRWVDAGGERFAARVRHPGTKPNAEWWEKGQEAAQRSLDSKCGDAVDAFCARLSR